MYGLWLFKEIRTEYGYCKVDIYRKTFTGSAIEIGGFVGDSLSIALENLDTITAPVGKSVCSFAIYDTEQVEYDDLFSPDATAFKVVVSTRVGSGAYVTRWSGYITPDFFAENLSYRTPISISARDNIGYLNDVDFDLTATTITVRELIQSAFTRIAEDYPMSLSFVTQKQTAEGILAIDATISTTLLKEMSWGEALETILHDLGLQMRWVDNNTIAVFDLSQIPEYYAIQGFNFVEASGYREIVPAWRQLSQEQNYGLRENFFEGWLREDNITFVKSVVMRPPNATNWTTDIAYYVPNNWGVARDIYTTDPSYYGLKFGKKIFFTGVSEEYPTTTYLSWRQQIQSSDVPMKMTFKAFNSVLYPSEKYTNLNTPSGRRLVAYNPKDAFHGQKVGEYLQIGLKMNVLLHSGLKTYILRSEWLEINDDGAGWQLDFTLPKVELSYVDGSQATAEEPQEEEVTINIATIPYDGELELRIYGWYIVGKHNYWEDDYSVTDYTFDWLKCLSYINEPVFTFNTEDAETGQNSGIIINELHNVSKKEDYIFGEVPEDSGAINTYAGGLFKADGNEMVGFQRNADAINYNLLELVGREIIHFNKRNYNRLSGTIRNLDKEPLMFNRLFVREGKKYAPYNYSLNVISNEMNITSMQEVEPYETATFNTIDSQITTGGGTVSGGNNTILQYSEEAGNEKRLYELQTATELEADDAYLLIDKAGFPEARKVHISELGGFDIKQLEQYLESNGYTDLKKYWVLDAENGVIKTTYNVVSEGEMMALRRASGSGGGGVADSVAWSNVTGKPTTLGGYGITDALSLSGGTISGRLIVTGNLYAPNIWFNAGDNVERILTAYPALNYDLSYYDGATWERVLTSKNYSSYALPLRGGTITGDTDALKIRRNGNGYSAISYYNTDGADYNLVGVLGYDNNGNAATYSVGTNTWYTLYHTGNFNPADYLPLSGGEFNFPSANISAASNPRIGRFDRAAGSLVFQLGTSNIFDIVNSGWKNVMLRVAPDEFSYYGKNIIHSGNIGSQSVNYANSAGNADTLDGYHAEILVKSYIDNTDNFTRFTDRAFFQNAFISGQGDFGSLVIPTWNGNNTNTYYTTELRFNLDSTNPKIRVTGPSGTSEWYTLARTIDNVASATKLQTARYIFGQPFDGSGNVDGIFTLYYDNNTRATGIEILSTNGGESSIGFTLNGNTRAVVGCWDDRLSLWRQDFGTILSIPSSGNVLIGIASDNGSKLQVNGDISAMGGISSSLRYVVTAAYNSTNPTEQAIVINSAAYASTYAGWPGIGFHIPGSTYATIKFGSDTCFHFMDSALSGWVDIKVGNLVATGELISLRRASSSDARLKDNINRLIAEDCLAIVRNLQPSSWQWKEDAKFSLGFIAQDIEPLMPYAVTRIKDEVLGQRLNLQYDQFFAPVVGAIQCLDKKVNSHETRLKRLETENAELKKRLSKYETVWQ